MTMRKEFYPEKDEDLSTIRNSHELYGSGFWKRTEVFSLLASGGQVAEYLKGNEVDREVNGLREMYQRISQDRYCMPGTSSEYSTGQVIDYTDIFKRHA